MNCWGYRVRQEIVNILIDKQTTAWWGSEESSGSRTKQDTKGSEESPQGRSEGLTLSEDGDGSTRLSGTQERSREEIREQDVWPPTLTWVSIHFPREETLAPGNLSA